MHIACTIHSGHGSIQFTILAAMIHFLDYKNINQNFNNKKNDSTDQKLLQV